MVSTDPQSLPEHSTSYLLRSLPSPNSERAQNSQHPAANLAEVLRLYTLRLWIEQSYKQLKSSLGWAHYQVRKDLSIRRHWHLVCCAFSFCWWASTEWEDFGSPPVVLLKDDKHPSSSCRADEVGGAKKQGSQRTTTPLSWPRALRKVRSHGWSRR